MANDKDDSHEVTLEWIQSLPPELKDAALLRLFESFASKPTPAESFALAQEIYHTISEGKLTESPESSSAD